MKCIILLLACLLFGKLVVAQPAGPIMDSVNKYQELIQNAKTQEAKIKYAMILQKIIMGKSAVDTAMLNHLPTSEKDALQQRNKQVAEIKKLKQNIDTTQSRKGKYTIIQKLQNKNDSIRLANKDAGKHGVLQPGLITLLNADQFLIDPLAPIDTSFVMINCSYRQSGPGSSESVAVNSTKATMYRQNGIIRITASNDSIPEFVMQHNLHLAKMVAHKDVTGTTARSPYSGTECYTSFKQNNQFAFAFYYNPVSNQLAAGVGGGLTGIKLCRNAQSADTSNVGVGFSCTNNPKTWVMAGVAGPLKDSGTVGSFTKTQTGFTFNYAETGNGISQQFSGSVTLSPPRYEAFIEASDTAVYRKWLPKGPDLSLYPLLDNAGRGNDINVKITLWDNKTHAPATDPYKAIITLNNVSKLPGYCMNFPEKDEEADDKPDMRFDNVDSAIYKSWSIDRIETRASSEPQFVNVVSYDYGAFAGITADVTIADGNMVRAHLRNNLSDTFTLPKRSNQSFIADYWKEQEYASDKKDTTDDEKLVKDDRYPGDGFTLFEEYRGFLEKRKFFRGDAQKKDIMVCNKIATQRSQDGIDMCEATLNQYGNKVYMHSHFKEDEFGRKHDPDAAEQLQMDSNGVKTPMKYDRCLNYNDSKDLHLVDQHGIVLMFGDTTLGYAIAISKKHNVLGPPGNMYFLVITKDFSPADSAWAVISGTLDANGHIIVGPGKAKIITDEYGVTVAHEMLHCFHVHHHGDTTDYGNWSFKYDNINQQWNVTNWFGQHVKDVAGNNISFKTHLYWESDYTKEITGADITYVENYPWHLFGKNSTHSGVEDCIMRYDNAHGYTRSDWKNIYLLRSEFNQQELTGINICNSATGTGVNDKNHKPIPRYGNAAPGRGDCIHQFCVSDRYPSTANE